MRTPIVERLRASTREIHDRVEAPFASLLREPTREVYARFLSAMWSFHIALPDNSERIAAIEADLLALDLPRPSTRCRSPHLPTNDHLLGAHYVIEGSTLGARVLYRHVAPALSLGPDDGARFLHAAGDHTVPRFRAFVARLEAEAQDPEAVESGAVATFRCLAELLGV